MKKSMPFYPDTYVCCDEDLEVGTPRAMDEEDYMMVLGDDIIENNSSAVTVSLLMSEMEKTCDESRCINRAIGEFLPGFSCWGEGSGTVFPYSCSDGYTAIAVDSQTDQPPIYDEGQILEYYTCCPPALANAVALAASDDPEEAIAPRRHCSDPISYQPSGNDTVDLVCNDPKLKYPRKTNKNGHYFYFMREGYENTQATYVCCDVELQIEEERRQEQSVFEETGAVQSFMGEPDCVLFCDPDYIFDCFAKNEYSFLFPMACIDPEGIYVEPKVVGEGLILRGTVFYYRYGCCKRGFGDGPFIQDGAFNKTVWPQLILSALGLMASVLLIVALLLSFLFGGDVTASGTSRNIPSSQHSDASPSSKSRGRSLVGMLSSIRNSVRSTSRASIGDKRNTNRGYNAYLMYLAIPDTVLNLCVVAMYGSYVNQKFNPELSSYIIGSIFVEQKTAFDMALILGCSAANMYLNAAVAHELFTLLKNSHRRLRTQPPTLRKASLQALAAYVWALCIALIRYFVEASTKFPKWVEVTLYFVISAGIPIAYLFYVCIVIWLRKLLPSIKGSLRVLALFFFRIIAVFLLLWLPGVMLLSFECDWDWNSRVSNTRFKNNLYSIGLYFCSVQPIVSTGLALTKPDVLAAFLKLLRFSYCRKEKCMCETQHETDSGSSS